MYFLFTHHHGTALVVARRHIRPRVSDWDSVPKVETDELNLLTSDLSSAWPLVLNDGHHSDDCSDIVVLGAATDAASMPAA